MEAATRLPLSQVRIGDGRLLIDGLVVVDESAVRLAGEREQAGEDPARLILDAIAIGARVLDREQTGANAEFVKNELEKVAHEVEVTFAERARSVTEQFSSKLDEALSPDRGHLARALEHHFSDGSSSAVQNRIKAVLDDVLVRSREDLVRQFSSGDNNNPLADFKRTSLELMRQSADQQHQQLRSMAEKMGALELALQELRAERDKLEEIAAVADKGTAKGRSYEEGVAQALDALAAARGDDCQVVGDARGVAGKKGDVVVCIDACTGPARGRIVFEAKDERALSKNKALSYLDAALAERDADYAVLVVPGERLPARTQSLREFNGDKLFVTFDPDDVSPLGLEVAYGLARARVLMRRGEGTGLDVEAVRSEVERAEQAMEDVRRIKSQLTSATGGIDEARKLLDSMAGSVRARLAQIDALLDANEPAAAGGR